MKTRRFFLPCLFSIITLCAAFFLQGSREIRKISLEETLSLGSLDDDLLFQWAGVVSDSQGHIYVTDSLDYTLKKFDSRGNLIKKTGRKGQGPGEFLAPRLVDCSEKFIYVTDQNIPGIHIFDKDLNFVRRLPLVLPVVDFRVLSDDRIAVEIFTLEKTNAIHILDSEGKVKSELKYSQNGSTLMMDSVSFDIDPQGYFYFAYAFQDRLEKFDRNGKRVWSQKLFKQKKVKEKKIFSFRFPTEIVYKDLDLDQSGNLFILGGDFSENRSRDVYVLNSQGNYLTTFILPDSSHCIYIDSQDYLYSRTNEGVTLKRFKMKYGYE